MTIYDKALNTYKAIYGPYSEPTHTPYYDASHTPFKGMDPELVKQLIDEREVNSYLKEWRKEQKEKVPEAFSHDYKNEYQYLYYRRRKVVLLPYIENKENGGSTRYYMVEVLDYKTFSSSLYCVYDPSELGNYRVPEPGEADTVEDMFNFKNKNIESMVLNLEPNMIGVTTEDGIKRIEDIKSVEYESRSARIKFDGIYGYRNFHFGKIVDL